MICEEFGFSLILVSKLAKKSVNLSDHYVVYGTWIQDVLRTPNIAIGIAEATSEANSGENTYALVKRITGHKQQGHQVRDEVAYYLTSKGFLSQ